MWLLLVLVAAGATAQLPGDYLPPSLPPLGDQPCPEATTQFITQTQVVSNTVTRHDVSTLLSHITISAHETQVVPSTVFRTVVQTVPLLADRTVYSERLQVSTETETVHLPGPTRIFTSTELQTETRRHVQHDTSTVFRTVTSTAVATNTVTRTQAETETVFYPSQVLEFTTKTNRAAPVTVTHVELRQLRQTITSQAPASTAFRTKINYVTETETLQVASDPVTRTETLTVPTEIFLTSTIAQPIIQTQTAFVTRVSTRLLTRTVVSTLHRTTFQQETQVVPQLVVVTSTSVVTYPVTVTVSRTVVRSAQPPAVTQPVTVTQVLPVTVTPPAVVRQVTLTSQIASTSVFTSTQLVTQVSTKVVEVTALCDGYQYNAPENPLRF